MRCDELPGIKTVGDKVRASKPSNHTSLARTSHVPDSVSRARRTATAISCLEALNGLPESKLHCSNLASMALRKAIIDHFDNHGREEGVG
jgi:hypothetical protein